MRGLKKKKVQYITVTIKMFVITVISKQTRYKILETKQSTAEFTVLQRNSQYFY